MSLLFDLGGQDVEKENSHEAKTSSLVEDLWSDVSKIGLMEEEKKGQLESEDDDWKTEEDEDDDDWESEKEEENPQSKTVREDTSEGIPLTGGKADDITLKYVLKEYVEPKIDAETFQKLHKYVEKMILAHFKSQLDEDEYEEKIWEAEEKADALALELADVKNKLEEALKPKVRPDTLWYVISKRKTIPWNAVTKDTCEEEQAQSDGTTAVLRQYFEFALGKLWHYISDHIQMDAVPAKASDATANSNCTIYKANSSPEHFEILASLLNDHFPETEQTKGTRRSNVTFEGDLKLNQLIIHDLTEIYRRTLEKLSKEQAEATLRRVLLRFRDKGNYKAIMGDDYSTGLYDEIKIFGSSLGDWIETRLYEDCAEALATYSVILLVLKPNEWKSSYPDTREEDLVSKTNVYGDIPVAFTKLSAIATSLCNIYRSFANGMLDVEPSEDKSLTYHFFTIRADIREFFKQRTEREAQKKQDDEVMEGLVGDEGHKARRRIRTVDRDIKIAASRFAATASDEKEHRSARRHLLRLIAKMQGHGEETDRVTREKQWTKSILAYKTNSTYLQATLLVKDAALRRHLSLFPRKRGSEKKTREEKDQEFDKIRGIQRYLDRSIESGAINPDYPYVPSSSSSTKASSSSSSTPQATAKPRSANQLAHKRIRALIRDFGALNEASIRAQTPEERQKTQDDIAAYVIRMQGDNPSPSEVSEKDQYAQSIASFSTLTGREKAEFLIKDSRLRSILSVSPREFLSENEKKHRELKISEIEGYLIKLDERAAASSTSAMIGLMEEEEDEEASSSSKPPLSSTPLSGVRRPLSFEDSSILTTPDPKSSSFVPASSTPSALRQDTFGFSPMLASMKRPATYGSLLHRATFGNDSPHALSLDITAKSPYNINSLATVRILRGEMVSELTTHYTIPLPCSNLAVIDPSSVRAMPDVYSVGVAGSGDRIADYREGEVAQVFGKHLPDEMEGVVHFNNKGDKAFVMVGQTKYPNLKLGQGLRGQLEIADLDSNKVNFLFSTGLHRAYPHIAIHNPPGSFQDEAVLTKEQLEYFSFNLDFDTLSASLSIDISLRPTGIRVSTGCLLLNVSRSHFGPFDKITVRHYPQSAPEHSRQPKLKYVRARGYEEVEPQYASSSSSAPPAPLSMVSQYLPSPLVFEIDNSGPLDLAPHSTTNLPMESVDLKSEQGLMSFSVVVPSGDIPNKLYSQQRLLLDSSSATLFSRLFDIDSARLFYDNGLVQKGQFRGSSRVESRYVPFDIDVDQPVVVVTDIKKNKNQFHETVAISFSVNYTLSPSVPFEVAFLFQWPSSNFSKIVRFDQTPSDLFLIPTSSSSVNLRFFDDAYDPSSYTMVLLRSKELSSHSPSEFSLSVEFNNRV